MPAYKAKRWVGQERCTLIYQTIIYKEWVISICCTFSPIFFSVYICEVLEQLDWVFFHFVSPIHAAILFRIPFFLDLLYKPGCLRNKVGMLQTPSLNGGLMELRKCPFSVVAPTLCGTHFPRESTVSPYLAFWKAIKIWLLPQHWDRMSFVEDIQERLLKHHILIFFFYFRVSIGSRFYCCYELPQVVF